MFRSRQNCLACCTGSASHIRRTTETAAGSSTPFGHASATTSSAPASAEPRSSDFDQVQLTTAPSIASATSCRSLLSISNSDIRRDKATNLPSTFALQDSLKPPLCTANAFTTTVPSDGFASTSLTRSASSKHSVSASKTCPDGRRFPTTMIRRVHACSTSEPLWIARRDSKTVLVTAANEKLSRDPSGTNVSTSSLCESQLSRMFPALLPSIIIVANTLARLSSFIAINVSLNTF